MGFVIKNENDLNMLKELSKLKDEEHKHVLYKKLEKQAYDQNLLEQHLPVIEKLDTIANQLEDNYDMIALQNSETVKAIRDQKDTLYQDTNDTTTIDYNVIRDLSKLQTSTNKTFKLTPVQDNLFQFDASKVTVQLERDKMIFEDGYTVDLTNELIDALVSNKNDLSKLNNNEEKQFFETLKRIQYFGMNKSPKLGDVKSTRARAIKRRIQEMQDEEISDRVERQLKIIEGDGVQGKGYKFLSSDQDVLIPRLEILLGIKEAGNDNYLDEATAIIEELLRQEVINEDEFLQMNNAFLS